MKVIKAKCDKVINKTKGKVAEIDTELSKHKNIEINPEKIIERL